MKIITDYAVYLQKYYFGILTSATLVTGVGVPISMFDITSKKIFNKYGSDDFIKFNKKEEIDFLKEADWIVDYNLYSNKSVSEIKAEIESIDLEGKKINESFCLLDRKQQESEYGYLLIKAKMLRYKRESLTYILQLKENNKPISLKGNRLFGRILVKHKCIK